jgi:hypothetical protein
MLMKQDEADYKAAATLDNEDEEGVDFAAAMAAPQGTTRPPRGR